MGTHDDIVATTDVGSPTRAIDDASTTPGSRPAVRVVANRSRTQATDAMSRVVASMRASRSRTTPGNEPTRVIRRVTVVDTETGEPLREMTVPELVDALPPAVRRALGRLPRSLLDALALLPADAQRRLLTLDEDQQLAIIDGLAQIGRPRVDGPVGPDTGGALVPVTGGSTTELPRDLLAFLMGNGPSPRWVTRVRLGSVPLLEGPSAALTDEQRAQIREDYGNRLASERERPRPSGARVTASPDVAALPGNHPGKVRERAEAEADRGWADAHAARRGTGAVDAAKAERSSSLAAAKQAVIDATPTFTGSKQQQRRQRQAGEPKELTDAKQRVTDLEQPLDEGPIADAAQREIRADLQILRGAGLSRAAIDGLLDALGASALHTAIERHGAPMLARLATHLSPANASGLIAAAGNGRLPAVVDDAAAAAIAQLLGSGASPALVLGALRTLDAQFATLVGLAPVPCVRLLQLPDLKRLKTFCQGGQAANLAALAALLPVPRLARVLSCVSTATDLAALCHGSVTPFADLALLPLRDITFTNWCRAPELLSMSTLLRHPGWAHLLTTLVPLDAAAGGPALVVTALTANVPAAVIGAAVAAAPGVLRTPVQALQHLVAHPAHTAEDFRDHAIQAASTEASRAPVRTGTGHTPGGAPYAIWQHHATIDDPTLMMLLDEGYARIVYGSTFKTVTESTEGGDTEEYIVETWDGAGWVRRWVVHLHRSKGSSKADAPSAAHIKRWEQAKRKDAQRIAVGTALAKRCREKHP